MLGPVFEIGRDRAGAHEVVCYVSLSADKPDLYDVVIKGPRGLSESVRQPPENSRRLFLFDSDAVVNPRR